jgi:nitrite reductase (NADH) small subunit
MSAPALFAPIYNPSPTPDYAVSEVCLGALEEIPLGQGRAFQIGTESVAVFRLRNGTLHAIQNDCPHRGAPLSEGVVGADSVVCPYHAWKFSLKSGECANDPTPLRTYAVREAHGMVYLTL